MEIRTLKRTNHLSIPKRAMGLLIKKIANTVESGLRLRTQAYEALQHAAEAHLINLLSDSCLIALHAKRVTLRNNDLKLVRQIRGERNLQILINFERTDN